MTCRMTATLTNKRSREQLMLNPLENMPKNDVCAESLKAARNGRIYCVTKAKNVTPRDCRQCNERPRSMFLREKGGKR